MYEGTLIMVSLRIFFFDSCDLAIMGLEVALFAPFPRALVRVLNLVAPLVVLDEDD